MVEALSVKITTNILTSGELNDVYHHVFPGSLTVLGLGDDLHMYPISELSEAGDTVAC